MKKIRLFMGFAVLGLSLVSGFSSIEATNEEVGSVQEQYRISENGALGNKVLENGALHYEVLENGALG
ncbi:hypothetical protein PJ311_14965 [Bacillus sp. CLL-7-23]|uniref:Uncharacterized protein n=1 Tax=Bacillus changyiensis TaxID=3004103 RepID=A0ABT4X8W7_9BACI|nr:hypothetical protein [Bacillus changyiensis]MDA7027876.1 hypothetical protein [Bacillus changyiensis]